MGNVVERKEKGDNCWSEVPRHQKEIESGAQTGMRPSKVEGLLFLRILSWHYQLSMNADNEVRSSLLYSSCCKENGHYLFHCQSDQLIVFLWAGPMSYSFLYTQTWYSKQSKVEKCVFVPATQYGVNFSYGSSVWVNVYLRLYELFGV